jgi:acyl-CoA thioester hydrolase
VAVSIHHVGGAAMKEYPIFKYNTMIQETQLDFFGHLNNANYLTLYEEARWDLISKNGYGIKKIQEEKKGPTILEVQLKFLRELRGRENIQIRSQVLSYEKKIGRLRQWIVNEKEEICSDALFTFALFDLEKRRLIEPTPAWRKALEFSC